MISLSNKAVKNQAPQSGAKVKMKRSFIAWKPSKGLGQNFLVDKAVLRKIIEAADFKKEDVILEIGPGTGILTKELAKTAKRVVAVEKDQKMCEILKETLKEYKNVEIIQKDILKIGKLEIGNFKIVANLPYYITSPVIRKFLEAGNRPELMILMVQKEVGQRICSRPPDMNLLAISVQFYAKPKIISYISKNSFWPKPKVDSAILKISQIRTDSKTDPRIFFNIVRAGFSQPRKQLINNLLTGLKLDRVKVEKWLLDNKIQPSQRAETLSLEDWIKLAESFPD